MAGSATDCAGPLQRQIEVIEFPRPIHSHMHRVRTHYPHNHCSQLQREMDEKRLSRERPRHYAHAQSSDFSYFYSGFPDAMSSFLFFTSF
jgi:hypothetical protein